MVGRQREILIMIKGVYVHATVCVSRWRLALFFSLYFLSNSLHVYQPVYWEMKEPWLGHKYFIKALIVHTRDTHTRMRPLIVSDGLCSFSQIDSNWTDSSNIKDINHPVTSFLNWHDRTKQTNPVPPIWDDRTSSSSPSQTPTQPLRNLPPVYVSKMSLKSFWCAPPIDEYLMSAQTVTAQSCAADWSLLWVLRLV